MLFNIDTTILFPFLTSFLITVIATPVFIKFIKKFKIMDDPKTHRHPAVIHKKPTPRGGGMPIFVGCFIASLFFLPYTPVTISLFLGSFIALAIGVLDDKFDVSPYIRFLIAIVWIVWAMNMLNWSKGVDGQMPGIVAISAIVIGFLSLRFPIIDANSIIAAKLSFIIAGSSLAFLIFNFYPAKIFPGYSATSIYLLLSVVSILSSAKLATAILVMGVPMMDGIFTVLRRIRSGRSPFWHDKKHLHHLLLSMGFSQRYIALFYWIFSAILGSLALILDSRGKLFAILMLLIIGFGALLFLQYSIKRNKWKS